jgi:phage baseplate assembly protein W
MVYYSDITDNMSVNPLTCQLALATNGTDVMNSLARLILMGQYDREYEDIGGNIGKMLFEPVDSLTAATIQQLVIQACKNEPRAIIASILVTPDMDEDYYVVTIVFSMTNNPTPIVFTQILYRIR